MAAPHKMSEIPAQHQAGAMHALTHGRRLDAEMRATSDVDMPLEIAQHKRLPIKIGSRAMPSRAFAARNCRSRTSSARAGT